MDLGTHDYFYFKLITDNIEIDMEGYNIIWDFDTMLFDKTIFELSKIFLSEYGYEIDHNKKRGMRGNEAVIMAVQNWLQGLPSVVTIPFYNYEILEKWSAAMNLKLAEDAEDEYLDINNPMGYWGQCAEMLTRLFSLEGCKAIQKMIHPYERGSWKMGA